MRSRFPVLLSSLALGVVVFLAGFGGAALAMYLLLPGFSDRLPLSRPTPTPTHTDQLASRTAHIVVTDQDVIIQAIQRVQPSLVSIHPRRRRTTDGSLPPAVSGFLFDPRGYVVTSAHAVAGSRSFEVVLDDERRVSAKLVGHHRGADVALLKLDADGAFPAACLGDSHLLQPGEWVVAVGWAAPTFEPVVSVGVVGGRCRPAAGPNTRFDNLIQTSIPMTPNNTGAPLVNLNGEVVGVCTDAYATSPGSQGLGFAVSVEDTYTLVDELIRTGGCHQAFAGISVDDICQDDARRLGLRTNAGALVRGVLTGGPAAEAGLQRHDVITRLDNQRIHSADAFMKSLRKHRAGDDLTLRILRHGKRETVHLHVDSCT